MVIKSTADLSIEELEKIMNSTELVRFFMKDEEHYPVGHSYDVSTLYAIKLAITEFLKGCPDRDESNPNTEKEMATYIYVKLAHMVEQDNLVKDIAKSSKNFIHYASDFTRNSKGIAGAMLTGYAHDYGFAETLRNLLEEVGIEAFYIEAKPLLDEYGKRGARHAWVQAIVDGKRYNFDVARDAKFILEEGTAPKLFTSNQDSQNFSKYPLEHISKIVKADNSLPEQQKQKLLDKFIPQVQQEIIQSYQKEGKTGWLARLRNRVFGETPSERGNE